MAVIRNRLLWISNEEIFGPVLTAIRFGAEEEAREMANAVDYGLTGYVWTNDLSRALRFTEKLEAGMIWVAVGTWLITDWKVLKKMVATSNSPASKRPSTSDATSAALA